MVIHSIGSMCKIKFTVGNSPYTGIFGKGTHHGLIRMGSAASYSLAGGGLIPGFGYKFPRTGIHSGDFVSLHKLDAGQTWNFFANNQSNHLPPAEGPLKLLVKRFEQASQCPVQIGISDLARFSQDGTEHSVPKSPFKLFMVPSASVQQDTKKKDIDSEHALMNAIQPGTTILTVYACGKPASTSAETTPTMGGLDRACANPVLLGDMKTESKCTNSKYGDEQFYVRHQAIEEDWQLNPSYFNNVDTDKVCGLKDMKINGHPKACGHSGADGMLNSNE